MFLFQVKSTTHIKSKEHAIKQLNRDEEKYTPIFKEDTSFPVYKTLKYYVTKKPLTSKKLHIEYIK